MGNLLFCCESKIFLKDNALFLQEQEKKFNVIVYIYNYN